MSATPNLGMTYLTSGQLQPEVTVNGDLNMLDSVIGGAEIVALTNANVTLTTAQAQNRIIRLQGTLTANVIVSFPTAMTLEWVISNETTGAYTVNVEVTGGTTAIAIPQGSALIVYSNGVNVISAAQSVGIVFNSQTGTSYTVQPSDENKIITMNNASANTVTLNAGVFSGNVEFGIAQFGAGATTIVAGSGVTINSIGTLQAKGQYAMMGLLQISQDNWLLIGNMN